MPGSGPKRRPDGASGRPSAASRATAGCAARRSSASEERSRRRNSRLATRCRSCSRSANCRSRGWASMRSGRSVFGSATSMAPRRRSRRRIERGNDGQPGLALLQLARGRSVAARSSIRAALADQPLALARARLLPAQVEISLACHDVAEAREAAEELNEIASNYEASLWHANAHQALGAVLMYEGDAPACHRRAPEGSPSLDQLRPSVRDRAGASIPRDGSSSRRG